MTARGRARGLGLVLVAVLALVAAAPAGAGGRRTCNLSACADRSLESIRPGPCSRGAELDLFGNPRELRFADGAVACPAGALGLGVIDPETGARVPVYDREIDCAELRRLCPRR